MREGCQIFVRIEHCARILELLCNSGVRKVREGCQIFVKIEHSARTLKAQGALRSHSGGLGRRILDRVDEIRASRKNRLPTKTNGFQRNRTDSNGIERKTPESNGIERNFAKMGSLRGDYRGGPVTVFRSHSLVTPAEGGRRIFINFKFL